MNFGLYGHGLELISHMLHELVQRVASVFLALTSTTTMSTRFSELGRTTPLLRAQDGDLVTAHELMRRRYAAYSRITRIRVTDGPI